jgi:AraC-like DNA-binding protein
MSTTPNNTMPVPVEFEFQVKKDFHFLSAFADRFNTTIDMDRVYLPATLGEGYIQQVFLDGLAIFIHNYKLRQEFVLKSGQSFTNHGIRMKFDRSKIILKYSGQYLDPFFNQLKGIGVEIGTCNINTEIKMAAGQEVNFIVIGTTRENLLKILKIDDVSFPIIDMVKNHPSFVVHELITPEIDNTLKQLIGINSSTWMPTLLYEAKARELIYYLFKSLVKRSINTPLKVSKVDAEKIYSVRLALLRDLTRCPQLPDLADMSGLGLTKLKKLFSQIFGTSIYSYFQSARMLEAASLLNAMSVSEVGYKLGFRNLSHFTRLFEKHHQIKPKYFKYKLGV